MMSGAWVDGTWAAVVDETPVDVLMGEEEGVMGVDVSPARLSLLSLLLCNAVGGRPGLGVMGARMWWMLGVLCPGLGLAGVRLSKGDRALVGGCCGLDLAGAAEVELVDRWRVGELVRGDAGGLMELGRRVSLLAYMLERGPVVREALPCMESIGLLWGLRATNKRSAICAAMMKIQADMDKCGMRLTMREPAVLWFQKARAARVSYEVVQRGNHNRKGGVKVVDEDEDEESVRVREEVRVLTDEVYEMVGRIRVRAEPVPMKAEFRGLSAGQLRLRLDALHEAAERRRLGV